MNSELTVRRAGYRLLVAWATLVFLAPDVAGRPSPGVNQKLLIDTEELGQALNEPDLRILDVRTPEEYGLGHLPAAVNLPAPATEDLEANRQGYPISTEKARQLFQAAGINAGDRIVLYDDQENRFAARVFYVLEFFGHSRAQVLDGGFPKWRREGRAITKEETRVSPGDFLPLPHPERIATANWVVDRLGDPNVVFIDARSPDEFRRDKTLASEGGHIPGAVNLEWRRALQSGEDRTFLEPERLRKLFEDAGIAPGRQAVTYCQTGMRSSAIYFALRLLGYENVRNYDGSWIDWRSNPALPVQ